MKEILSNSKLIITKNGIEINLNIKKELLELLDGSYFSPSYVIANNEEVLKAKNNGIWIEVIINGKTKFKDYSFDGLLFQLKPKYNFLTLIRKENDEYTGKCININLATNTTRLFKLITEDNNEK